MADRAVTPRVPRPGRRFAVLLGTLLTAAVWFAALSARAESPRGSVSGKAAVVLEVPAAGEGEILETSVFNDDSAFSSGVAAATTRAGTGGAFRSMIVRCSPSAPLLTQRLFSLANAKPGAVARGCVLVTYTGSKPARVVLYGRTKGTGLDRHVDLTVRRGRMVRKAFKADGKNYLRLGGGVIYSGTLQLYPDSAGSGLKDAAKRAPERWTRGESHAYEFVVTLRDTNLAQGLTALQAFTWRARA